MSVLTALVLSTLQAPVAWATPEDSQVATERLAARAAAEQFLQAFDALNWDTFQRTWADVPSVFFPFEDTPERVRGREAVVARFRRFFDETRARAAGPPYLHLQPSDLQVDLFGTTALVTFMLRQAPPKVGRRTLLFVKEGGTWKLAHLHASNLVSSAAPLPPSTTHPKEQP